MDVERTGDGLVAVDATGRTLRLAIEGWEHRNAVHEPPASADATVVGAVTALTVPLGTTVLASVDPLEDAARRPAVDGGRVTAATLDAGDLGPGSYRLTVSRGLEATVRFDGPATVRRTSEDRARLAFDAKTPVTVTFRSPLARPTGTITVTETPAGLARAVTAAASAHRSDGPDRSSPTMRGHPPLIEYGNQTVIPRAVRDAIPDAGVSIEVPATVADVLGVAPLAYYLGATVSVAPDARPRLRAASAGVECSLEPLVERAPQLLARVFWLDCLVRHATSVEPGAAGDDGRTVECDDRLDALGLDPLDLAAASPAERLTRYVAAPFDLVADDLPAWHLATYVRPTFRNARTLPYLLDRLSLVYPPETEPLPGQELMERSLDDFYRGETANVDVVKPALRPGRLHGWLSTGSPIDVFKALPEAYENRLAHLDDRARTRSVTVVLNDEAMAAEHAEVATVYRERAEEAGLSVVLRRNLSRSELADEFAAGPDLLHYIGHCETDGFLCSDGTLAATDIPENRATSFFLNACGSYYEGLDLIRSGSVAGAVTHRKVLDEQAATVGATFAKLLVRGFSFERATRLARRRIMMGKDYAVVGDGTYAVGRPETSVPIVVWIESGAGTYEVTCEAVPDRTTGTFFRTPVPGHETEYLCGDRPTVELDETRLTALLAKATMPAIFDGTFYWSDELEGLLREGSVPAES